MSWFDYSATNRSGGSGSSFREVLESDLGLVEPLIVSKDIRGSALTTQKVYTQYQAPSSALLEDNPANKDSDLLPGYEVIDLEDPVVHQTTSPAIQKAKGSCNPFNLKFLGGLLVVATLALGSTLYAVDRMKSQPELTSAPNLFGQISANTGLQDSNYDKYFISTPGYVSAGASCVDEEGGDICSPYLGPNDTQYLYLAPGSEIDAQYNVCDDKDCRTYLGHVGIRVINQEGSITAYSESVSGGSLDVVDRGGYFSLEFNQGSSPTAAPVTRSPSVASTFAPSGPTMSPVSASPTVQTTRYPTSSGPVAATEETLKIAGVSVNVWKAPDGTELVVPVGNSLSGLDYTPSEAWGYAMRNAVEAGDKEFFLSLTQSYLYYANQASVARSKQGLPLCEGLMGWSPYLDPSKGGYPSESYYFSAASDADLDILTAMMKGFEFFGDTTITDTLTPSQEGVKSSISLKDLIIMAGKSFVDHDLGTITYPGSSESSYMLTNDNWGHNPVNPDYFDPTFFYNLHQFFEANGVDQSYQDKVANAAKESMEAIFNYAKGSGGWIGDYPSQYPAKANNFGYDAVRILMRFGEFIATPDAEELFGKDFYDQGKTVLLNLVNNLNPLCIAQPGGTYQYNGGSGLSQAQFTGPLLMSLTALKQSGVTEIDTSSGSQPIDSVISTVRACFNTDMRNYNINGGMSGWQPYYFSMELGVLDDLLMEELISKGKSTVR